MWKDQLDPNVLPVLSVFPAFTDHVQDLTLSSDMRGFQSLSGLPLTTFPCLSSLNLSIWTRTPSPIASAVELFSSAPRLRDLHVHSSYTSPVDGLFAPRFPWAQLTRLFLSVELDLISARTLLMQCTELRSCSFPSLSVQRATSDHIPPSICGLPHLKHLTVLFEDPDYSTSTCPFFDYFSFPNLQASSWTSSIGPTVHYPLSTTGRGFH